MQTGQAVIKEEKLGDAQIGRHYHPPVLPPPPPPPTEPPPDEPLPQLPPEELLGEVALV